MFGRRTNQIISLSLVASMLAGCMHLDKELHYIGKADLQYYKDQAETIDYPNVCTETPPEVLTSTEPRTLRDRRKDEIWNLSLSEAIQIGLRNSRVIRTRDQFAINPATGEVGGGGLNSLAEFSATVYDPAIQETSVLFGNRGIEAALADFDSQFATSMIWGRNEQIQNNAFFGGGITPGSTLVTETGNFQSSLQKQFAYGGSLTFAHDWDYLGSNVPGQLFPSSYTGNVRAEYRQPLWAGAGAEYTRIAGPLNASFRGITGVSQGVVIARINNDITIADFEFNVNNMIKDIEDTYWDLYLEYQLYRTAVVARNSALKTWRDAEVTDREGGIEGFDKADVPQARDAYFGRKADAERQLNFIYVRESELRRLLGLPVADGRIIRPSDEPARAEFMPDWYISLSEALAQRVELRKQKWTIKSLELQYEAAQSLTNPQLDFVSSYRVNGFGDKLLAYGDNDGITGQGLNSAYETLTQGNQTGWNLGLVFSMPLGFRSAHAQVRNYELRMARARAQLAEMEKQVGHSLAVEFQNIAAGYQVAQSNLNRRMAARERVDILEKQREGGVLKADLVIRAQASLADADQAFYRSLVDYNKAITNLHYLKGTILENNSITVAESMWTPEAYRDALRRAWARSHAISNPALDTEPAEFVIPGQYAVQVPRNTPAGEEPPVDPQPAGEAAFGDPTMVPQGVTGETPRELDFTGGLGDGFSSHESPADNYGDIFGDAAAVQAGHSQVETSPSPYPNATAAEPPTRPTGEVPGSSYFRVR